jgi:hypothetical protein
VRCRAPRSGRQERVAWLGGGAPERAHNQANQAQAKAGADLEEVAAQGWGDGTAKASGRSGGRVARPGSGLAAPQNKVRWQNQTKATVGETKG